jgi:hypothetical protein
MASFVVQNKTRTRNPEPLRWWRARASRKRQNQQNQQDESTNMASFVAELNEDAKPQAPKRERGQEATNSDDSKRNR